MELDEAMQKRKSVKKFSDKKPNWEDIIECIDAARFSPMAAGNYSVKFILVDDREKIKKLTELSQQKFFSKAHYLVIVCTIPERTKIYSPERGDIFLRQQAGAAIENFILKIEEKGLATCWIGHFLENEVKHEFSIPKNTNVEAFFPIGYENSQKKLSKKRKIALDRILYFNEYGNEKMKNPKKLDV